MISIVELRAHMGKYLGMVKEGQTLGITSHRRPVAQLSPSPGDVLPAVTPPTLAMRRLKSVKGIKPASGTDGLKELLQDRRRR